MRPFMILFAAILVTADIAAQADEKSHRAAAEELLTEAMTEKSMRAAIDTMLDVQLKANRALVPVKDVMKKFFVKHLSYESLKEEMIDLHVAEFTEGELKEVAAFYRTPTGKKFVEKQPVMMQKGAELGMRRVQENAEELQILIQAELNKSQK